MSAPAQISEEAWVELAEEINTVVRDGFARRDARINALQAQNARLEAAVAALTKALESFEHQGVWDAAHGYLKHNQVTYDGSSWYAVRDTRGRPGTPDSGWKLTTKRGRDGRDAKK